MGRNRAPASQPRVESAPRATALTEARAFTVLREQDGICYYRLTDANGRAVAPLEPENDLFRAACLEKALAYPQAHRVSYYRVGSEPVRLVIESRQRPANPAAGPATLTQGQSIAITWYYFRAIPVGVFDLQVGDANVVYSPARPSWSDLELVLEALNNPARLRLLVRGDPSTGRPVLTVLRPLT